MKHIKILGLALVAAFALSAVGASGASAALLFFECDAYPCHVLAPVTGGKFVIGTTEIKCTEGEFLSELINVRTEWLLMLAAYNGCKLGGIGATVNMGSCHYTFHTDGTVDIGPAGCGPIKITAATCEVKVGAQNGLGTVTYENLVDPGGLMLVEVNAKVKKIAYTTNKGFGCPAEGLEAVYEEKTLAKGLTASGPTGVLVLA